MDKSDVVQRVLNKLELPTDGTYSEDGCYTVDISDSDTFAKYQSKLDKAENVEEDDDLTVMEYPVQYSVYETGEYRISLIGNLEEDTYKIVVEDTQ